MPQITTVRPEVESFTPYAAGLSVEEIRQRYGLTHIVKLASNENPLGASPLVQKAVKRHANSVFRYARAGNPELVAALADHLGVPAGRIVAGNGSDEIIDLVIRVKCRPGRDRVLAFSPCFALYELQSKLCGVHLDQVPLGPDFAHDLRGLAEAATEHTAVVFVTNPDNPSGAAVSADELARLARALPEHALLVVDEAYIDFAGPEEEYSLLPRLEEFDNLVVLRTFSKAYGLAGLRLGYGVMPEWLAAHLLAVKPPFSVNILAEKAGLAALGDQTFLAETVRVTAQGRAYLETELARLGCSVWPSRANFLLVRPPMDARVFFEQLLARGVIVRHLSSYAMPEMVRITVGTEHENRLLIGALEEVLHA